MAPRIQLTLAAVALCFGLFAFFYVRNYVTPKPHGVIVFIAHGLNPELLTLARVYDEGLQHELYLDRLSYSALIKTYSANRLIPDEAAATMAIATGKKTPNELLGLDAKDHRLDNLIYRAQRKGRKTGLITTAQVTDPTPAAFYANTKNLANRTELAAQFMDSSQLDILMGGGKSAFRPPSENYPMGLRQDGRNLIREAKQRKFSVIDNADELEDLSVWGAGRVLALFDEAEFPYRADLAHWFPQQKRPTQHPLLSDMVRRAIELLQFRVGGYLLVVDSALIAKAISQNQAKRAVGEVLDLDIAVKTARKYAGENALIVVISGYNVGGLTVHGSFSSAVKGNALFQLQTNIIPSISWQSGPGAFPNGSKEKSELERLQRHGLVQTNPFAPDFRQPALLHAAQAYHTAGDSLVLASGPGAEKVHGILENTDLFEIINSEL
jgi:alkaline phosphatase